MIARFIKIYIGVVLVLIVGSVSWGIIPLEAILPTAIPLSVVVFIGIALLKKMGFIPNSDRDIAGETTNYNTSQRASRSTSTPKAKKAAKAAKQKMPKPKCKHAKLMTAPEEGKMFCYCKSEGAKMRSRYAGVSRRNGEIVTGSSSAPKEPGNDWTLCVGGRCWQSGITPSKCRYYVT